MNKQQELQQMTFQMIQFPDFIANATHLSDLVGPYLIADKGGGLFYYYYIFVNNVLISLK